MKDFIKTTIISFLSFLIMGGIGLLLVILLVHAAEAQSPNRNCADREKVVSRLAEGYGETRQSIGLGANNTIVEMFTSTDTGTWTITVTTTDGVTCLVASGQ